MSGFHVVSLNAKEEIDALQPLVSTVEFVELPPGRELPLIDDFLDAIARSSGSHAGIVNADCLLLPATGLDKRIRKSSGALVIAERLNVSPTTFRPTGRHCYGFDAFFFETKAASVIERGQSWRISETWWDYWLPLAFHFAKIELRTLPAPFFVHLDHDQAWDAQVWEESGKRFANFLRARADTRTDAALAAAAAPRIETATGALQLSDAVFCWLRAREPLWRPIEGGAEELLTRILLALATPAPPDATPRQGGLLSAVCKLLRLGETRRDEGAA